MFEVIISISIKNVCLIGGIEQSYEHNARDSCHACRSLFLFFLKHAVIKSGGKVVLASIKIEWLTNAWGRVKYNQRNVKV